MTRGNRAIPLLEFHDRPQYAPDGPEGAIPAGKGH